MMRAFLVVILAGLLAGCGETPAGVSKLKALIAPDRGLADLEAFVTEDYGPPEPIKPLPPLPTQPVLVYGTSEYLDLFSESNAGIIAPEEQPPAAENYIAGPDPTRRSEPLEAFPLDQLEWVGLVETERGLWVLIRDPNGGLHRVTLGHYIGQDFGKIEGISQIKIDIAELRRLPDGNWAAHSSSLSRR